MHLPWLACQHIKNNYILETNLSALLTAYKYNQCNLKAFGFHFYTLTLKSFASSYLRPILKSHHLCPAYVTWLSVHPPLLYYLLLWLQQVCFTLQIKNLLKYRWGSSNFLHHPSSVTCNTLRCLRTELGFRKHFPFSPAGLADYLLNWSVVWHTT